MHRYTLNCIGRVPGLCGKKQHPSAIKIKSMQSQLKCQLSTITYRGIMQCKLYENIFPTKYCCVFYANLFNCFHCIECAEPGDEAKFFPQIFKRAVLTPASTAEHLGVQNRYIRCCNSRCISVFRKSSTGSIPALFTN